jgi:hypothetical protein
MTIGKVTITAIERTRAGHPAQHATLEHFLQG